MYKKIVIIDLYYKSGVIIMVYLDKFILPIDYEESIIGQKITLNGGYIDNRYPCDIFSVKNFKEVDFSRITIFYGGNGSGKTTLLNLIANKLNIVRTSPYNSSELFDTYVNLCKVRMGYGDFGERLNIPNGSKIICSDDIFDYMLNIRENNNDIAVNKEIAKEDCRQRKYASTVKLRSMADYDDLRLQVIARKLSQRKFASKFVGDELKLNSNGETAMRFFIMHLQDDKLYLLDEPENSLSPAKQIELAKYLEELAKYCGCQFVISTHSPFLLAIEGAKIYDLDAEYVDIKNWWELENTKTYFEFFDKYRGYFVDK